MTASRAPEAVVERVAEMLLHHIGLRPDPTLRGRLHRAIRDEMGHHAQDPTAYLDRLAAGGDVLQGLLNRITVQETAFFRHPEHFDVLTREVLPTLPRPVKIWSAGCANGQEAYSLAMLLAEHDIAGRVIATDVSTTALRRAAAAHYLTRELSGLSPRRIASHLRRTADGWQICPAVRDRVTVLRHNLLDPLPAEVQSCQVIFCRNVLIYLSPDHVRAFLDRVAGTFPPATPLFLGAAETIWQVSDRFAAVPVGDTFIYRQAIAGPARSKSRPQGSVLGSNGRRTSEPSSAPRRMPVTRQQKDPEPPRRPRTIGEPSVEPELPMPTHQLAKIAHEAIAAGDFNTAVVAFRKCAYLEPDDPVAHLQLGLALEAAGDQPSAQRAYAVARHLLRADSALDAATFEGYATAELASWLDLKQGRNA